MDMSTHTQLKMEIVAPPPKIDISTHSRFKMEIVAVPPPSIDRSTHTFEGGDCATFENSSPLPPRSPSCIAKFFKLPPIFLNRTVTPGQVKLASRIGKTQQNVLCTGKSLVIVTG